MVRTLEQLSSEIILENPYWSYRCDDYTMPNGGKGKYYYAHTEGSVCIIPRLKNGTFLLVKQYRYLNRRISTEFPGGGVKKGMIVEAVARMELAEETGFQSERIQIIGTFNPCNGITDEMCHVFLAEDLIESNAKPDESEEFEVITASAEEMKRLIRTGEMWDGMSLAAWSLYNNVF